MDTKNPRTSGSLTYLSKAEILSFATTRIESKTATGISTGSGFFFEYFRGHSSGKSLTVIATNKHVVEGSLGGHFTVTIAGPNGMPDVGRFLRVPLPTIHSKVNWIPHPDADIDLAVLPIGPFIGMAHAQGVVPYISTLTTADIALEEDLKLVAQAEPVMMPGYPQGIWDPQNNQPIFRRGFCATHPALKYAGGQEFLVDIECQPGSSGSPVLLMDCGEWRDKWGDRHEGDRIKLLGVLYAGFMQTAEGEIVEAPIPVASRMIAGVQVPIGLAKCVASSALRDFEKLFPDIDAMIF